MAINLSPAPLPIFLSRNVAEIGFSTPDKFTAVGAKHVRRMIFTDYPTDEGDTLKLAWSNGGVNYERTFTFKTTPDINQYHILKYSGSGLPIWLQALAYGVVGDPDVARDWAVSVYNNNPNYGLQFHAQFEDAGTLEITATGFNVTSSTITAGVVGVSRAEYRLSVFLRVGMFNDSDDDEMLRSKEIELDSDNSAKARLDIQPYLDAYLAQHEPPTATTGAFVICELINRPAYIIYGQKWNTPYERQRQYKSIIFRVLKGGVEDSLFATIRDNSSLATELSAKFLTLRSVRKIDFATQDDWLFFLAKGTIGNCALRMKMYKTDGTTNTVTIFQSKLIVNQTYQFYAGASIIPPDNPTVYKYDLWLTDSDQVLVQLTEPVTFINDSNYLDLIFEYENSLGAIESWRFTGEHAQLADVTKQTYETPLPFGAPSTATRLKSYDELIGQSLECSTGPMTAEEAVAYADFLRSRYQWLRRGAVRIPVRITGGKAVPANKNLSADYARSGKFIAEVGLSANVSAGSVL